MAYELKIKKEDDILRVTATGARSLDTILAMSKDVLTACVEKKVKKALSDVRELEGRLGTLEAFEIADRHFPKMRDPNVITQIAIVDLKEFEHDYKFFEDVVVNRDFNLRIFSDPEEALKWLKR